MKSALALLIFACALTACSNTGNPYGNGTPNPNGGFGGNPANPGAPAAPGQDGSDSKTSGPNTALTETAWCAPYHNQGRSWQFRLSLSNAAVYETRIFAIAADGGRGAEVAEWGTHGSYQLDGASFTMMDSNGQTNSYTLRLDPADAVTGAKKLHLTNAAGDAAFDPCY